MVLAAGAHLSIAWEQAYLVGDHWTDVQAGLRAGCRTVLVLSGRGLRAFFSGAGRGTLHAAPGSYLVSRNLGHAVTHILRDDPGWPYGLARRVWQQARDLARKSTADIANGIARADTVFKLDATLDNLIDASSNISSNRVISRVRSPIN